MAHLLADRGDATCGDRDRAEREACGEVWRYVGRTGALMMGCMKALMLVAMLLGSACAASAAAPYDGSAPMKCAIEAVFVCHEAASCTRGTAQTVSLPPVVTVDVANRLISGAATGRTARITAFGRGAGQLLIHGEEAQTLGKAWGLNVSEKTGAMSGAVLSPVGGFLMFGTCSAP
jgi:hypothetical protein